MRMHLPVGFGADLGQRVEDTLAILVHAQFLPRWIFGALCRL
jgi:hypothetical protein